MKNKSKIIAGVVVVALVGAVFMLTVVNGGQAAPSVTYTALYKAELKNSISAKGIVKSTEYRNVYSTLNYTVESVEVEVGDTVQEGQVLCRLDTEDLELNIAQQKADLDQSQKSSLNSLQNNQRIYNETMSGISEGSNSQLLNAQNSIKTTEVSLANAQRNYDNKLKEYTNGTNAQVTSAKSTLQSAEIDLATKKKTYDENELLFSVGGITQYEFDQSETAYINAQNKYTDSVTSLANAEKTLQTDLEQLENTLRTAQINYDNAVASENAAVVSVNSDLEKQKSSISSSQIALNTDSKLISIQRLEKQLEDSTVRASISGTITAVYAKAGSQSTGLLFVIENTDDLKITTNLKEYDLGKISVGMPVTIKSDATGNSIYDGTITKIAPTSVKGSNGESVTSTDAEFEITVSVLSKNTDLKIGMNTRLNIILDKKEDVFSVPYDAVTRNANGDNVIYVVEESGKDKYKAVEIVVATGLETDFYIEISGDGLTEGIKVINDASKIMNGMEISVN